MLRRALIGLLALTLAGCAAGGAGPQPPWPSAPARLLLAMPADRHSAALRPVDPATLADLPDFGPIPFGHHYTYAFSPDGRTLAAILWPSGEHNRDGVLHLIDLETWTDRATTVRLDDHVDHLFFGSDGGALYWLQATERDPAHGIPQAYALFRYRPADGEVDVVTRLPGTFMPYQVQLLADGGHVAIYGQPTSTENLAVGDARVLRVPLADGKVDADIPLEGLVVGQFKTDAGEIQHAGPGIAWDRARDLLYVVHGAPDQIAVVDLKEGKVARQAELRTHSWLERLGLESVAAAKLIPGTRIQAALSPDGKRLYVTAFREEVERPEVNFVWRGIPLGLRVVDTASLREVGRLDLPVSDLALTPDGRQLLLWGTGFECETRCTRSGHGVYLVDARKLTETAHLLPENDAAFLGFSPDGRYAYIGEATGNSRVWHLDHRVLDLSTARLGAKREMPPGYGLYLQAQRR